MLKESYGRSLKPGILHFAAHSHHPRPNVTRDATLECWDDAARMLDKKWDHIFGEVVPRAQKNVAGILDVNHSENIAFGANTQEFLARIVSSFDPLKPLWILTTGSEFRNASRMFTRLSERPTVSVHEVRVWGERDFMPNLLAAVRRQSYDLVFLSQVFFDTGARLKQEWIEEIVDAMPHGGTLVIDGYHGFCAVPTSLRTVQDRVFYTAGGYKYAQWGEGGAFLYVPPNCVLRPENTGWFAEFGELKKEQTPGRVAYPNDAFRFWGATFDPAGLYRLNAVCQWMGEYGLSISRIHEHVQNLQKRFLGHTIDNSLLFDDVHLMTPRDENRRGNFLAYGYGSHAEASRVVEELARVGVVVDSRGPIVRIGFGLYHDEGDVDDLTRRIRSVEKGFIANIV